MYKKEAINLNSYDANFKKIISNKSLLTYTLKTYIEEYKNVHKDQIKQLLNTNFIEALDANKITALKQEFSD